MPTPTPPPPRQRQIFLGALEIATSSDRITYIERECQGDATLRSAVDKMLEESDQLGSFLEQPPAVELQTWREGKRSEHIGPYKLLQEIGEGGCGVVYMAEQERPVKRRVALKVIKLGMDTKSVIARFESERQALAMMDHPNIAKVLDAGATENGRPYFVMELVRGVRITDYSDQHKLSTEERLRLFVQVSQAIQHAHQKGIIHRDIKPSNILVTLHDGVPVPKIIDFGIAKAVDQRLTDKTLFTEFQSFIGTPAYMSPEQAEMTGLDIDTRSDIYSLGVLLYELLVGSTPFDPKTLRDAGLDECRRTIREEEPAKPSQRLSTLVNADRETIAGRRVTDGLSLINRLRGDLDWIVMKCLDKNRQRRYATANALALDVQCYMDGSMVSARPPSTVYRLQKAWRRNRLVFAAASAVITALVLGIGASTYLTIRATNAEQESTELRVAAEASLAQAIESTSRARLNEYVADMNVANHSLQDGNFGRAWQLIEKHEPEPETEDLRGFEWRYLAHRSQGDNHLAYPMQGAAIESLAFSNDGILLAVGMDDETKVWDVRTLSLVTTLPASGHSLAFVANDTSLVTGDDEGAKVWHTTTWTEQLSLPSPASSMAVSPNGQRLAICAEPSWWRRGESAERVQIWNTASWEEVASISDLRGKLSLSPNGDQLAISSRQGIHVFDATNAAMRYPLEIGYKYEHNRMSSWLSYSPDGTTIVAPRNDNGRPGAHVLNVWEASSGREMGIIPEDSSRIYHKSTITSASWTPDGKTLVTGSWDHSIQLWDAITLKNIGSLRGHRNEVWATAVDPSGETVASGGKDGELLLWPLKAAKARNDRINGQWQPIAFDSQGTKLAAIDQNNKLEFFDTISLHSSQTLDLGVAEERRQPPVALSTDLMILAIGKSRGEIEIRDLATDRSRTLPGNDRSISNLTLSPTGQYLIVERRNAPDLEWWDLQTDTIVRTITGEDPLFSSDGSTLATSLLRTRGEYHFWNTESGTLRSTLKLGTGAGRGSIAALSSAGKTFAISTSMSDADHAIRLWDVESSTLLGRCRGHKQWIRSVAFSPDGKTLASASEDSSLKLWNVTTQQELLSVHSLGLSFTELVFSQDGQWLAAGSRNWFSNSSSNELRLLHAPIR